MDKNTQNTPVPETMTREAGSHIFNRKRFYTTVHSQIETNFQVGKLDPQTRDRVHRVSEENEWRELEESRKLIWYSEWVIDNSTGGNAPPDLGTA